MNYEDVDAMNRRSLKYLSGQVIGEHDNSQYISIELDKPQYVDFSGRLGNIGDSYTIQTTPYGSRSQEKKEKKMRTETELERLKALRERRLDYLDMTDRRIADLEEKLANRIDEPPVETVIWFEKQFLRNAKTYSWVAYRAHEGEESWYLSQDGVRGAQQPRMSWDELLDFIDGNQIWVVAKWEVLR